MPPPLLPFLIAWCSLRHHPPPHSSCSPVSPPRSMLLASASGELFLAEEGGGELAVSLALDVGRDAGFGEGAYMGTLQARRFGRWMLLSLRMASTHDLVMQNFAKLLVGVVCVTDVQFKGRLKNVWESPPACLMFSFTSQMNDARKLPLMQYVICLAITEAIKDFSCAEGLPELDVRIKWPNDLYLKGLKVGGILCTSSYEMKVYNICTVVEASFPWSGWVSVVVNSKDMCIL